jgi:hypothetical protein
MLDLWVRIFPPIPAVFAPDKHIPASHRINITLLQLPVFFFIPAQLTILAMYSEESQQDSDYDHSNRGSNDNEPVTSNYNSPVNAVVPSQLLRGKPKPKEVANTEETKGDDLKIKKVFFLPSGNKVTFIDHGTTLDSEGYPLLPNGNTVFVKPPDMDITNWGEVGFTKKVGVEYRSNGLWKLRRINCLGVLHCNRPGC